MSDGWNRWALAGSLDWQVRSAIQTRRVGAFPGVMEVTWVSSVSWVQCREVKGGEKRRWKRPEKPEPWGTQSPGFSLAYRIAIRDLSISAAYCRPKLRTNSDTSEMTRVGLFWR